MNAHTPKGRSNAAQAVEQLRTRIFNGELGAGTDHLESDLAESLGMSRTPVREALLVLEGQGLVDVRPRRGVRIRPLSPDDMAEVYDVLTSLESLAVGKVAGTRWAQADLAGLSSAINKMDEALACEDLGAWADADDAFHNELVRLYGNSRVATIVAMMSDQVKRARLVTLHMRPPPLQSNADHRKLLQYILDGDVQAAQELHLSHCDRTRSLIVDLLRKHHLTTL